MCLQSPETYNRTSIIAELEKRQGPVASSPGGRNHDIVK